MLENLWLRNVDLNPYFRECAVRDLYDFPCIRESVIRDLSVFCKPCIGGAFLLEMSVFCIREKEEIWLSPMTKAPTPSEKFKKQRDNTKTPPKLRLQNEIVST